MFLAPDILLLCSSNECHELYPLMNFKTLHECQGYPQVEVL